jgi:uncharacterized protein YlxP (DUF503 family)
MAVGILILSIKLPGCQSLKEKRSRISPMLHRIHEHFNVSISETDHQNAWQTAGITCAIVSNDRVLIEKSLHEVARFVETHWPDEVIYKEEIEII